MSRRRRRKRAAEAASSPPPRGNARRWIATVVGVAVLAAAGAIAARYARRPKLPADRLNLLLVTLDTTRADRLGCYGYAGAHTPYLDRLAAEGVRFDQALVPAPITLPSHASILTGLYPFEHGVRNNGNFYLGERFPTLTTVLRERGYGTAAFVSSFILDRRYGLARGFDTYDDQMEGGGAQVVRLEAERRGDRTALALARWLDARSASSTEAFFVWLHLYDPHEPYAAPPPFRERFAQAPYDGEIAFADAAVASILDKLRTLGLLDRTIVAVIGDHGESLGDHGEETHSMFVYEAAIRVPLILWRPGRLAGGRVISEPVRASDLAPTLLDLLGAPALKTLHGRSLLPLIEGRNQEPAPAVYAETYLPKLYMNWAPLRSLRDQRYKLIDAPRPELYDLREDPGETRNRYADASDRARALHEGLRRVTADGDGAMSVASLDREAMEKLAALGYVGAGGVAGDGSGEALSDPKDMIAIFNRLRRANSAVRDQRFADALPILREVLEADPRNAFAQLVLGSAYMGMGDEARAIAQYRRYLELVPTSSYAHQWLAICHLRLGDRPAALREAEAALALDPRFTDARILRAGIWAAQGLHPQAIAELRAAVETDPAKPMVRLDLAKVLVEAGHPDDARTEYEAILKREPDYAPALVGLGALLATQGDVEGAATTLRRALALDPAATDARMNLARVLERSGQRAGAAVEYRRVADDPRAAPPVRAQARQRLRALGS